MAEHHVSHATDNDYAEHERTYSSFIGVTKWATIFCIVMLMFIGSTTSLIPWALTLFVAVLALAAGVFM